MEGPDEKKRRKIDFPALPDRVFLQKKILPRAPLELWPFNTF